MIHNLRGQKTEWKIGGLGAVDYYLAYLKLAAETL